MKRVKFETIITIHSIPSLDDMTIDDKQTLWWSHEELRASGKDAKANAKAFRSRSVLSKGLDDSWLHAHNVSSALSEESELQKHLDQAKAIVPLSQWCNYGQTRRGLEKWSSKAHSHSRTKSSQMRKVLTSTLDDSESLRRISEDGSRPSRIFARMMGIADAIAASNVVSDDPQLRQFMSLQFSIPNPNSCSVGASDLSKMHGLFDSQLIAFLLKEGGDFESKETAVTAPKVANSSRGPVVGKAA